MSSEALRAISDNEGIAGNTAGSVTARKTVPGRTARIHVALDPTIARLAVELSLPENHLNEKSLEPLLNALRELTALDCVFVALFDQKQSRIETVSAAIGATIKKCKPETLIGAMQPCSKEMLKRLGKHQLLDVRDYNTLGPEHELFSSQIASLNLSSALVGGIHVRNRIQGLMFFGSLRRRSSWDVETHLIMKLMAASYAAGHERLQLQSSAA
ncbi:MAG: hypothetical protein ABUL58_01560 [Steroidobacter sp.]